MNRSILTKFEQAVLKGCFKEADELLLELKNGANVNDDLLRIAETYEDGDMRDVYLRTHVFGCHI